MATFGYETIGSKASTFDSYINGSQFTCTLGGTGDKISVALRYLTSAWTGNAECAVYLASDLSAPISNGETETRELTLTAGYAWYDFNFPTSPTFAADTDYCLYAWGSKISGDAARICRDDDAGVKRWYLSNADFPNWPSLPSTGYTGKYSIHCDYTPSAGVTVKPGSIVPLATQLFLDFMKLAKTRFPPCPILRLTL